MLVESGLWSLLFILLSKMSSIIIKKCTTQQNALLISDQKLHQRDSKYSKNADHPKSAHGNLIKHTTEKLSRQPHGEKWQEKKRERTSFASTGKSATATAQIGQEFSGHRCNFSVWPSWKRSSCRRKKLLVYVHILSRRFTLFLGGSYHCWKVEEQSKIVSRGCRAFHSAKET